MPRCNVRIDVLLSFLRLLDEQTILAQLYGANITTQSRHGSSESIASLAFAAVSAVKDIAMQDFSHTA